MSVVDSILNFAGRHHAFDGALRELNRTLINQFARATKPRPRAFSLWSPLEGKDTPAPTAPDFITDYTSWPALVDKRWSGRHLRPADAAYVDALPDIGPDPTRDPNVAAGATALFARGDAMTPSRSSLLFMFFAQWFTDSILRFDFFDRRKNTSNHDIDLCSIYGLTEETCRVLRTRKGGLLRSQIINGEEYLEYLCEKGPGFPVRADFAELPIANRAVPMILDSFAGLDPPREPYLYATGLERGNSSIGYVAISTIFMREHNRIARDLEKLNPTWNDERIFQTARIINIVILMKLVVEDYINHILGHHVFKLDHEFAEEQHWYRANWIALEFDLLYRWHGLPPDSISVPGKGVLYPREFRNNNRLLEELGVGPLVDLASRQAAGRIGLGNTPTYLIGAEWNALKMCRDFRVRPYNEYRELFSLDPIGDFAELTPDPQLQAKLEELYGTVDRLEYFVGLFAEEPAPGLLFGGLLNRMVAYDAFTQIFSNPLLSRNVYHAGTFTDYGLELIDKTTSIEVLVNRNVSAGPYRASLGLIP